MPEISRFYGIVIFINYKDHMPPHFHARYEGNEVSIEIDTGKVTGTIPKRALAMIFEWMEFHRDKLLEDWNLARNKRQLNKIEPLK